MELERRSKIYKSSNSSVSYPLTGKIKCGICGKNYRHKINNAGTKYANPVWICSTYNTRGKKHCPSKQIPVNILEEIIRKFDNEPIEITAYPKNRLKFVFKDNTELETTWRDKSRKWTGRNERKNYHNLRKGKTMSTARKMTVIPAIPKIAVHNNSSCRKRVAAYARAQRDTEEQLSSYEAQVDHYTNYIKIMILGFLQGFTDEGISATNTKRREGLKDDKRCPKR